MGTVHEITVTYLEMRSDPRNHTPAPADHIALLRAVEPPVSFYRYLYDAVGRQHVWVDRKRMSDDDLRSVIHDPGVEVYVLYRNGWPAGYSELDFRKFPEVELAYMGLTPEAVGQGLGKFLLTRSIAIAWAREPERVIVQTCTLDHPAALPLYQKSGFVAYARKHATIQDMDDE